MTAEASVVAVDPRDDSEIVSAVYDRIRAEYFRRIGIGELLTSHAAL
ncbi:short-chain dehydrogenase/reductase [Streptomyces sp. NPDC004009]